MHHKPQRNFILYKFLTVLTRVKDVTDEMFILPQIGHQIDAELDRVGRTTHGDPEPVEVVIIGFDNVHALKPGEHVVDGY